MKLTILFLLNLLNNGINYSIVLNNAREPRGTYNTRWGNGARSGDEIWNDAIKTTREWIDANRHHAERADAIEGYKEYVKAKGSGNKYAIKVDRRKGDGNRIYEAKIDFMESDEERTFALKSGLVKIANAYKSDKIKNYLSESDRGIGDVGERSIPNQYDEKNVYTSETDAEDKSNALETNDGSDGSSIERVDEWFDTTQYDEEPMETLGDSFIDNYNNIESSENKSIAIIDNGGKDDTLRYYKATDDTTRNLRRIVYASGSDGEESISKQQTSESTSTTTKGFHEYIVLAGAQVVTLCTTQVTLQIPAKSILEILSLTGIHPDDNKRILFRLQTDTQPTDHMNAVEANMTFVNDYDLQRNKDVLSPELSSDLNQTDSYHLHTSNPRVLKSWNVFAKRRQDSNTTEHVFYNTNFYIEVTSLITTGKERHFLKHYNKTDEVYSFVTVYCYMYNTDFLYEEDIENVCRYLVTIPFQSDEVFTTVAFVWVTYNMKIRRTKYVAVFFNRLDSYNVIHVRYYVNRIDNCPETCTAFRDYTYIKKNLLLRQDFDNEDLDDFLKRNLTTFVISFGKDGVYFQSHYFSLSLTITQKHGEYRIEKYAYNVKGNHYVYINEANYHEEWLQVLISNVRLNRGKTNKYGCAWAFNSTYDIYMTQYCTAAESTTPVIVCFYTYITHILSGITVIAAKTIIPTDPTVRTTIGRVTTSAESSAKTTSTPALYYHNYGEYNKRWVSKLKSNILVYSTWSIYGRMSVSYRSSKDYSVARYHSGTTRIIVYFHTHTDDKLHTVIVAQEHVVTHNETYHYYIGDLERNKDLPWMEQLKSNVKVNGNWTQTGPLYLNDIIATRTDYTGKIIVMLEYTSVVTDHHYHVLILYSATRYIYTETQNYFTYQNFGNYDAMWIDNLYHNMDFDRRNWSVEVSFNPKRDETNRGIKTRRDYTGTTGIVIRFTTIKIENYTLIIANASVVTDFQMFFTYDNIGQYNGTWVGELIERIRIFSTWFTEGSILTNRDGSVTVRPDYTGTTRIIIHFDTYNVSRFTKISASAEMQTQFQYYYTYDNIGSYHAEWVKDLTDIIHKYRSWSIYGSLIPEYNVTYTPVNFTGETKIVIHFYAVTDENNIFTDIKRKQIVELYNATTTTTTTIPTTLNTTTANMTIPTPPTGQTTPSKKEKDKRAGMYAFLSLFALMLLCGLVLYAWYKNAMKPRRQPVQHGSEYIMKLYYC